MSRCGPLPPLRTSPTKTALVAASEPRRSSRPTRVIPNSVASTVHRRTREGQRPRLGPIGHVEQLDHVGRAGRGQLVEVVGPVDDHGPAAAVGGQHPDHLVGHGGVAHPHHLVARPPRVGQGPEEVEDRGDPELTTHGAGEAHGRVEARREAEAHARLVDAAGHAFGPEVDRPPRAPPARRPNRRWSGGPAAVLAHPGAGAGHHEGGDGRDVDATSAVATGPAGVDQVARRLAAVRRGRAWPGRSRPSPRSSRPSSAGR